MPTVINNGTLTPEQWVGFGYDNLTLAGVSGAEVNMGDRSNSLKIDSTNTGFGIYNSDIYSGAGNDAITILRSGNSGIYKSKLFLGDGNDLVQSARYAPSYYHFQLSLIDGGAGNDSINAGISSQTTFTGGLGKDTITFPGNRSSWDLEFSFDANWMEITTGNGNKLSGFEVFVFDDVRLDFSTAPLDGRSLPTLNGIAPALNSSLDATGKAWRGLGYDRFTLAGISGAVLGMGDGDNTLRIDSKATGFGVYDSEVYSGAGNDNLTIMRSGNSGVYRSKIFLGDGNDHLESARYASNYYHFQLSLVDCGDGNDSVDAGIASQSTFVGGPGRDTITFEGMIDDWQVQFLRDSAGQSYLAVGTNKVYGFQTIRFQKDDPVGLLHQDVNGGQDGADPFAPWRNKPTVAGPLDSIINPISLRLRASKSGSKLVGESLADTLLGGSAADVLVGRRGADTMTGNGGQDLFLLHYLDWNEGDVITDFNPSQDRICLTGFPGVAAVDADLANPSRRAGVLATGANDLNAVSASARFVYSRSSGNLYFNANGSDPGVGAAGTLIAQLPVGLDLNGQHLMVSEAMFPI